MYLPIPPPLREGRQVPRRDARTIALPNRRYRIGRVGRSLLFSRFFSFFTRVRPSVILLRAVHADSRRIKSRDSRLLKARACITRQRSRATTMGAASAYTRVRVHVDDAAHFDNRSALARNDPDCQSRIGASVAKLFSTSNRSFVGRQSAKGISQSYRAKNCPRLEIGNFLFSFCLVRAPG